MNPSEQKISSYAAIWGAFSVAALAYVLFGMPQREPLDTISGIAIMFLHICIAVFADLYVPKGERLFWNVALATVLFMMVLFVVDFRFGVVSFPWGL